MDKTVEMEVENEDEKGSEVVSPAMNGQEDGDDEKDVKFKEGQVQDEESISRVDDEDEESNDNSSDDSDSEDSTSSSSSSSSSSDDEEEDDSTEIDGIAGQDIPGSQRSKAKQITIDKKDECMPKDIQPLEIVEKEEAGHQLQRNLVNTVGLSNHASSSSKQNTPADDYEDEEDSIKGDEDDDDGDIKEGQDEENTRDDDEYVDSDETELLDSSEEIDEDEIDDLLEQGFPESKRIPKKKRTMGEGFQRIDCEYNEKEIVVLEEKGKNTLEVIPGGWIEVRHCSGMPLYLHRKTRICTLAKPYFLGPGSVRRHSIPLSAIPCLAYRRALDKENSEESPGNQNNNKAAGHQNNDEAARDPSNNDADVGNKKDDDAADCQTVTENSQPQDKRHTVKCPNMILPFDFAKMNTDSPSRKRKSENEGSSRTKRAKIAGVDIINNETKEEVKTSTNHQNESTATTEEPEVSVTYAANMLPFAKVATAKENNSAFSITPTDLRDYCKSLFNFKSVKCKRFRTWSARRKHTKEQKRLQLQRPSLPEGVKLISFPVHNGGGTAGDNAKPESKEYIMNPQGKSSVCILHEYVQHALRKQPSYIFRELENASTPYAATVVINSMQYGTGYGSSKKQAKADAAKSTLEILIPQMREQLDGKKGDSVSEFDFIQFFEPFGLFEIGISKWCKNFSEPPPYALLLTCLQRNFGQGMSSNVKFDMISTGNQSNKFQMQVGEHSVEVTAANKREGKQLASQHLLAKLHPNINNFGAFIKLYGTSSIKSVKEKKQEEQQITTLQSRASPNSPNWAILLKLKEEMQKLVVNKDKDVQVVSLTTEKGVSTTIEKIAPGPTETEDNLSPLTEKGIQ